LGRNKSDILSVFAIVASIVLMLSSAFAVQRSVFATCVDSFVPPTYYPQG
jgi:hypothetical protein